MADQEELQRKNQELIRQNRSLGPELKKNGKVTFCLLGIAEWAVGHSSSAAFTDEKVWQPLAVGKGDLIAAEERINASKFLAEGVNLGVPIPALAEVLSVCQRTLRCWRIHISGKI